jgi:outer membrane protein
VKRSIKSTILGLAAAAALAGMSSAAYAELKIGVLNYGRLMEESPQGQVLLDQLRSDASAKQRELQGQATTVQGKKDKLAKDRATMSADQISRAEKDIRDGERELARKQAEIQDDFNAKRNEEMSKLQRSLIEEVNAFGKAQNFDLIITTDSVIFGNAAIDVTPQVLQSLQARGGAARPAAAPAAAPAAPRPAGR